jgi:hypothetical protein
MMEKSALAGVGVGVYGHPFTLFTITYKVAVYAPTERADTDTPISSLPYMFSVDLMEKKPWLKRWRTRQRDDQRSAGGSRASAPGHSPFIISLHLQILKTNLSAETES